jgi:hypothetical protein
MVATELPPPRLNALMKVRYGAWCAGWYANMKTGENRDDTVFVYTSAHQQYRVQIVGTSAVVYAFHEAIELK